MPYDFGLNNWRGATPPFLPEEEARDLRMPSAPPPPPSLPTLDDGPDPVVPSAASQQLQTLIHDRMAQKPSSIKRQILGSIVGNWLPSVGQDIANPGQRKFMQQYNLLNEQAKLEGSDFDRRLKAEDIKDKDWNRRYLRYAQIQDQQRKVEEANQRDATTRSNAGEQILTPEPYTLPGRTITAPTPQQEVWPEGSGPPSLQPLDSQDPKGIVPSAKLPGFSGISQPTVPKGYYSVPRTDYDPKNALRVKPTLGQLAKEKVEAAQTVWLDVTPEMVKALPNAGLRAGQKVPPATWQDLVNKAHPNTKLEFKNDTNEVTGDMTIIALDPSTGKEVTRTVVKAAGQKRPQVSTVNNIMGGSIAAPSQAAQDIADYKVPLATVTSRMGPQAKDELLQQIHAVNPDFHAEYFNTFQKTENDATTGKIGTVSNALNTMMGHLTVLDQATAALKNNDIQLINKIANQFGVQTGATPAATFQAIVNRVGPEIVRAYVGTGGDTTERQKMENDFSPSMSPQQIKSNIRIAAQLALGKLKSNSSQYKRGTYGRGKQRLISDEAATALRAFGLNPDEDETPASGPPPVKPPAGPAVDDLKKKHNITY